MGTGLDSNPIKKRRALYLNIAQAQGFVLKINKPGDETR
ncbi:hypothetical protein N39L_31620 [Limnospira platensis NIES-39]|uniref:Transposase n=1 Tax=Limnospira platensis NIES-46 TaxID=1236695 RepID=A0A5M3T943_LIMPL|nr:hypothetical protein N39L_31620 [Arthrospira platensis NIES-39]GCE94421.1 hypothetical protein NIES46_24760 [Arthrospira platensis NIES-46]